uniref:Uncharacterized protein n=1 Tax=Arundo donax TaxID=35708 RepID=A0A0A9DZL5_ARUDO
MAFLSFFSASSSASCFLESLASLSSASMSSCCACACACVPSLRVSPFLNGLSCTRPCFSPAT